jgi:ComF family protein
MFYGRCRADRVHAEFYFSKGHTVQRLIHALKYEGDRSAGRFLGRMMGHSMMESKRFSDIDVLLPLPLYLSREKERGYNQAVILCRGIQDRMPVPLLEGNLVRMRSTETQTRKDRTARWQNVENSFRVTDAKSLKGARILLVDDVITTGATLESCCEALAGAGPASISIAVAAIASK